MELKEAAYLGILIFSNKGGTFIFEKKETFLDKRTRSQEEYASFEEALKASNDFLNMQKEWQTIIRYNKGLGIEYKNLPVIFASTKEDAKVIAEQEAEKILGNSIIEVKVKPKFSN
jgi:hypothetical protein